MYAKTMRWWMCLAALCGLLTVGLAGCGGGEKTDKEGSKTRSGSGGIDNPILAARGAAFRAQRMNDLRQIGLAMSMYANTRPQYPPAAQRGPESQPLLSWRVLLLPYLDQQNLYTQFELNEPWDSEHNRKLIDKIPAVYGRGRKDGKTSMMVFVGPNAPFGDGRGPRLSEIRDGASNTILCVDAGPDKAVPWTKPEDLSFDPANPIAALGNLDGDEFLAVTFDGAVHRLRANIDPKVLAAMINPRDGESVSPGAREAGLR